MLSSSCMVAVFVISQFYMHGVFQMFHLTNFLHTPINKELCILIIPLKQTLYIKINDTSRCLGSAKIKCKSGNSNQNYAEPAPKVGFPLIE